MTTGAKGPREVRARGGVTMHDVAALAGVSFKTVSNVLNDYPHIRPTTRARVEAAIAELGYQVNASARNLRRGRTGVIGLALPGLAEPYFGELADTVVRVAETRGVTVLVEHTAGERAKELDVLTSARRSLTDGLLLSPLAVTAEDLRELRPTSPLVLLGERVFGAGLDHVTMANVEGARLATRLLLDRGARRIAVVGAPGAPGEPEPLDPLTELTGLAELAALPRGAGVPDGELGSARPLTTTTARLRLAGYLHALVEAGLEPDPALLLPTGDWHRTSGAAAMDRALAVGLEVDAVLGLNDSVALGALHALQLAGVDVPGRVQVVGFDDTIDGAFATPALTSVSPGREVIASSAVDLLLRRIEGVEQAPQLVVAPVRVEERGSTRRA